MTCICPRFKIINVEVTNLLDYPVQLSMEGSKNAKVQSIISLTVN